jgi:hypothetical protein
MPRHVAGSFGNPFDQKRQHADLHVALDAPGEPMAHGRHLDLGALERAEAALDDHQPLVSARVPTGFEITLSKFFKLSPIAINCMHLESSFSIPTSELVNFSDIEELLSRYLPRRDVTKQEAICQLEDRHRKRLAAIQSRSRDSELRT